MVIDLRDRIPVAQTPEAFPVRFKDLLINERPLPLYPGKERGAKIETEERVVVEDIEDLSLSIDDPRIGIGPVTFEGDPFIPVMKRASALLTFNDLQPWILPWRLIEMAMNGHKGVFHLWSSGHDLNLDSLSYIRFSISKQFL
jgi:hypothetical protein